MNRPALTLLLILIAGTAVARYPTDFKKPLGTVSFGSCNKQFYEQPLWPLIDGKNPDLWIWLGDNIYPDYKNKKMLRYGVTDPADFSKAYNTQLNVPAYKSFHSKYPVIGIWDDHDYGLNNAGAEYPLKEASKNALLDFLNEPKDSPRRKRAGAFASYEFGPIGKKTKIILLDNRWFAEEPSHEGSLLGKAQWKWLKSELKNSDAQIHLICSGLQILAKDHRYEKWANYPKDRDSLLNLISRYEVPGVIFLSGDRHIHEFSESAPSDKIPYPLLDITCSGLSHSWTSYKGEENSLRIGKAVNKPGYGLLKIDWDQPNGPLLKFTIRGQNDEILLSKTLDLNALQFSK